jgi:hypothetical protein
VGKVTEGTSNGGRRYLTIGIKCGTLTKLFRSPSLALDLGSVGVVEVLAGLALVLVAAGDAVSTRVTTRRRRAGCAPPTSRS